MTVGPSVAAYDGGCTCRFVRYRMTTGPMFVHCCHCRWCQRESGSAFALNALIEADRVKLLAGEVEVVDTPSSQWQGAADFTLSAMPRRALEQLCRRRRRRAIRSRGTLDGPDRWPPDIHIYTASKQPWLALSPGTPAVPEYYEAAEYWPAASLERRAALIAAASRPPR